MSADTTCAELHRDPRAARADIRWHDVLAEEAFALSGFDRPRETGRFARMPADIAASVSDAVGRLAAHTAGGQARFRTDSPFVALRARMPDISRFAHMNYCATAGFDLYVDADGGERFFRLFMPPHQDMGGGYESFAETGGGIRSCTLNFPLYSAVSRLEIGLAEGAALLPCERCPDGLPVVFYGSSITQGACASRPGNAYPTQIARALRLPVRNLGFSGACKGEAAMTDYLAALPARALVLDYDFNAPTPDFLRETHAPLFLRFREKQPDTPVLLVSRAAVDRDPSDAAARFAVIARTVEDALRRGDRAVALLDGGALYGDANRDECTVDGIHPTDLGLCRMARGIGGALAALLARTGG